MALVVESSGTQACTINTPHTLAAPTTNKTRVLRLDLSALLAGEMLRVQIQTKVLTGGTLRNQYDRSFVGIVGDSIVESVPVSGNWGATFIITQTTLATGRSIDWAVLTLD